MELADQRRVRSTEGAALLKERNITVEVQCHDSELLLNLHCLDIVPCVYSVGTDGRETLESCDEGFKGGDLRHTEVEPRLTKSHA